ncbi:MAG: hypothetical protein ACOWYE_00305 [Desulfatiglandales bacterium]
MSKKNAMEPLTVQETTEMSVASRGEKAASTKDYLDIPALVRSIQRADGEPDCFRRPKKDCRRVDCKWRRYCLEDGILGL